MTPGCYSRTLTLPVVPIAASAPSANSTGLSGISHPGLEAVTYHSVHIFESLRSQSNYWEIATMISHSASLLFALVTMAFAGDRDVALLDHSRLAAGQKFEIQTADRVFRGQIVDRATGECQLAVSSDGASFAPARTAFLLGATAGPQGRQMLVVMHQVRVGLKMELGLGDLDAKHREITSEVKAIRLLD